MDAMDSLTAAIALVIDNDKSELQWALGTVRSLEADPDVFNVRRAMAEELQERVAVNTSYAMTTTKQPYLSYLECAISHVANNADWHALAQHYMDKVDEGVTVPE